MTFEITKIVVIITHTQGDLICIHTTLPDGIWPFKENERVLQMNVTSNKGEEYVKLHFPNTPFEVIKG